MLDEGPALEGLLRRLVETPSEFLAEPLIGKAGEVDVAAVVWDVLRQQSLGSLPVEELARFRPKGAQGKTQRDALRLTLLACWLLSDEGFRGRADRTAAVRRFLTDTVPLLAPYLPVDRVVNDADRREELARRLLNELGLRPAGETEAQALDRLQTLDTAERARVLSATAVAERRAREIREAMARQRAADAASRFTE
jgi:hypothetical protein